MSLLRRRVMVAILGVTVFGVASGGVGALYAARNVPAGGNATPIAQVQQSAGPGSTQTGTPDLTPVAATPTLAPTVVPTRTPRPTPTPLRVGQRVQLDGTIGTISTSSDTFVLRRFNSPSLTIDVTSATQYQGAATSFQGLQSGWQAQVVGIVQTDESIAASQVNSSIDN